MRSQPYRTHLQQVHKKKWWQLEVVQTDYSKQLIYIQSKALSYHLFQDPIRKCKVQGYRVKVNKKNLADATQIYDWRRNTQLPINKTFFVNVVQENDQSVIFDVYNQFCEVRLGQLYQIPLGQALYLLKQALVGFQRLFNNFGPFQIKANLIMINQKKKCKVWLNENVQTNFTKIITESQDHFLHQILDLFSQHVIDSPNSKKFFQNITQKESFIDAILFIEQFAKAKNIKIPNRFILNPNYMMRNTFQLPRKTQSPPKVSQKNTSKSFKSTPRSPLLISRSKKDSSYTMQKRFTNSQELQKYKLPSQMFSTMKESNAITSHDKKKSNISNNITMSIFGNEQCSSPSYSSNKGLHRLGNLTTSGELEMNTADIDFKRNYSSKYIEQPDKRFSSPLIKIAESKLETSMVENSQEEQSPTYDKSQKKKILDSQDQSQTSEVKQLKEDIFKKNGWKFEDINNFGNNMKASVQIGKQVNLANESHPLLLLSQKKNLRVCDSVLPESQW